MDVDGTKHDEVAVISVAAEALGKDSNDIADALKELDIDHYDDDDDDDDGLYVRRNRWSKLVQAVASKHHLLQILLSGSFDHSIVMKDVRKPSHSGCRWSVATDVESLAWDPHTEHSFVVSLENGLILGFDI